MMDEIVELRLQARVDLEVREVWQDVCEERDLRYRKGRLRGLRRRSGQRDSSFVAVHNTCWSYMHGERFSRRSWDYRPYTLSPVGMRSPAYLTGSYAKDGCAYSLVTVDYDNEEV